jgi:hypothetical protein
VNGSLTNLPWGVRKGIWVLSAAVVAIRISV